MLMSMKRLKRWEHEDVLDQAAVNLKQHPEAMRRYCFELNTEGIVRLADCDFLLSSQVC